MTQFVLNCTLQVYQQSLPAARQLLYISANVKVGQPAFESLANVMWNRRKPLKPRTMQQTHLIWRSDMFTGGSRILARGGSHSSARGHTMGWCGVWGRATHIFCIFHSKLWIVMNFSNAFFPVSSLWLVEKYNSDFHETGHYMPSICATFHCYLLRGQGQSSRSKPPY